MVKEKRSSKWIFLLYLESAPKHYQEILNKMQVSWILSPEHDQDVNIKAGKLKNIVMVRCSSKV